MRDESQQEQQIPVGLCQCGCGQKTPIASRNDKWRGWKKGLPIKYFTGHAASHSAKERGKKISAKTIGKRFLFDGYIRIKTGSRQYEFEHVLMAEKALGRKLKYFGQGHPDNQIVHHVNGVKSDNRNDNFLICTHSYHVELHEKLERSPAWPEFEKRIRHPRGMPVVGSTGFKGVCKSRNKFYARFRVKTAYIDILSKMLDTAEEAARAYDAMAVDAMGNSWITNKSLGLLP